MPWRQRGASNQGDCIIDLGGKKRILILTYVSGPAIRFGSLGG